MEAATATFLGTDVPVPELGQVVRCRNRVWAVNEVTPSLLPPDPIGGARPHHLVLMSSFEDDGFGDELSVIWMLEPGTTVIPHHELTNPEIGRLDPPDRRDAFLQCERPRRSAGSVGKAQGRFEGRRG